MITDDLVKNAEVARSPDRLDKLWNDYRSTLTTRMIGDNVKQIMLGTIWSDYDPISRMKDQYEGDPRYSFIAIPVWDEVTHVSNFNYRHPDRYSEERIEDIKNTIDEVDFSCLYMQRPIGKEGLAFAESKLRFYNGTLPDGEPDKIIFTTDVAWGGGDSLSAPFGYMYGDDIYIADVVFNREDKTITKPMIVGKIIHHKVNKGRFEANNGGDEYADDITRMLKEQGYWCNIESQKAPTNISKLSRIEQHAPTIRNQFVFLAEKYRNDEYKAFMRELTSFSLTAKNKHDDAADSCAMLADFAYNHHPMKVTKFRRNGRI
jgi:predicted phage terminase large subunit-like protein